MIPDIGTQRGQVIDLRTGAATRIRQVEPGRARIPHDALEGWESRGKARDGSGVVFTGAVGDGTLAVDALATEAPRAPPRSRT